MCSSQGPCLSQSWHVISSSMKRRIAQPEMKAGVCWAWPIRAAGLSSSPALCLLELNTRKAREQGRSASQSHFRGWCWKLPNGTRLGTGLGLPTGTSKVSVGKTIPGNTATEQDADSGLLHPFTSLLSTSTPGGERGDIASL